jgi:hypothetical protein
VKPKGTASAPNPQHITWLGKWGDPGASFTRDLFRDPAFATEADARRAWSDCRRAVWATCHRFRVPSAAELFDGITCASVGVVRDGWHDATFPLTEARAAVAEDREHLAVFRARDPVAAATIADFLASLEADLELVDTTARALAAVTGLARPYPHHLGSAISYAGSPETA